MIKILIVDDSKTSRKMLRGILEDAGMEVIGEAADGQEALKLYTSLKPDIVTLDITMPVMDGIKALKELMALDRTARIVMVTAAGQKGNVVEALKLGAKEFVAKPYEVDLIIDVINKAMEQ
ncbi:MAG: response regulator [Lachnospiraceae bacterium]|nr:response regulator [Lachnospiraceae bacterium]